MGIVRSSDSGYSRWEWSRQYMNSSHRIGNLKEMVSLALGLVSVISWAVAEIPQIITNYKQKSAEGISLAFLLTWIIGDLFNFFGCMLEPATLPTQFYMALLFTITSLVLAGQAIYYGHIYHRLKFRQSCKTEAEQKKRPCSSAVSQKQNDDGEGWGNATNALESRVAMSSPIPLPTHSSTSSPERELYYTSARSLSRSHTPTVGSFLAQRRTPTAFDLRNSLEEPLLGGNTSTQSTPPIAKNMLCVFSAAMFVIGTLNVHLKESNGLKMAFEKPIVIRVGRKLLQIRRGKVEGLNPLMFVFALVGNTTYVASILVSSLDWAKIRANLPWLVDAGGCVILDTFILIQFIYFRYRTHQDAMVKL
ncbi:probable vacuolar amino acid transporter YPQ3 isoform X2 [Diospyros lotus]|uniref:probable vacuolar amino acid transporter YPQ3 isoform X2 n=1 Tax=Diospyros lotus TaxID=55363 RepID=UPI002251C61B|nr:probable vacuolar amino acid transporter YPQ3 isoform X2 [Diospyros lotus]